MITPRPKRRPRGCSARPRSPRPARTPHPHRDSAPICRAPWHPGRAMTLRGLRRVICVAAICAGAGAVQAAPGPEDPPLDLASPSIAVLDAATGDELYARRADDPRAIASMTKIFVAIALRRRHLALDRFTEINHDDAVASQGGAHTLLVEGEAFRNRDLLYAMLLSSDNRVPSALARSVGLSTDELIAQLRRIAADLGLSQTRFVDATGIHDNQSTAREMA